MGLSLYLIIENTTWLKVILLDLFLVYECLLACLCSMYMQCLPWTLEETVLSSGIVRVVSYYVGAGNGTGPLEEHLFST